MNPWKFTAAFEELTPRRRQVLKLLLAGASDRDIAQSLHIEASTVRKHVENICLAFGLKNDFPDERRSKRGELIALFAKHQPEWVNINASPAFSQSGMVSETISERDLSIKLLMNTDSDDTEKRISDIQPTDLPISPLYNRDVFILIDQSGSMVRKDSDTRNQTRYEYLAEVVEGHIAAILSAGSEAKNQSGAKICDRVFVYFFSRARTAPHPIVIQDASHVWKLFVENQPKTKTFVCSTLHHCINTWLTAGKPKGQGAFFIIYTDGQFDDEEEFINCIASVCTKINDPKNVKFFVLGLGKDIDIEHFLALDFNVNQIMPFNIFVFDLVNEVDDIIELLSRQLTEEPHLAFPDWVRVRHPELVEKVLNANETL
ncbi:MULTISPECIES: LuxR C-terminal-related transcriptional regulator [unclassified Coleofasciculus]|uniref:LuxR C-terminal-related transcriptional regulator n=1 Tax=unclassified Coleofasciculus TaxID=2692782 RepID=UPI00187DE24F|nr:MULTISPECIES: LuxR C-terminal-related transcriptional regulator [unclassified Coleofasciculus]MBE9126240.1 RNA polymerase subunit sigma-70 [Coleofasciculus sp. LEGE 07081]MBE9148098.1 RNA polymerase subunit sigma-70 [Coleofasciculus sp. LEGE 07092]